MRRKKIFIPPALKSRKGDLSKRWYVELSQRDPATDKMVRKRFEVMDDVNINDLSAAEERKRFTEKLINNLNGQLDKGWTIFSDTSRAVYQDQLQYATEAIIFKKMVESNANYAYWSSRYITEVIEQKDLEKESVDDYRTQFRIFGQWLTAKKYDKLDIVAIDNAAVASFFTYLKEERNLSKHTYLGYANRISGMFDFVKSQKGIAENPVHSLPANRNIKDVGAERIRKNDLEKMMHLMDAEDRQLALACRFEYYCGLRPGQELRFLKIGDIDFRRGYSKVRVIVENSKVDRRREVTLPDAFLDYLLSEWRLDAYNRNFYVIGKYREPGLLPIGKNTMRYRFNKIREKLGMPLDYKYYSMKHTGATTIAEQGEPIINIRDHLGHTDIRTTEIYLKRHGVNETRHIRSNFPKI
ncbi:MAG: site-specific integrase [Prevotellaceae bacterium]|jgi:integrase|nr:site-specific integrase [Prevotellaceae bacterium]